MPQSLSVKIYSNRVVSTNTLIKALIIPNKKILIPISYLYIWYDV
jgi:hypothetical protein